MRYNIGLASVGGVGDCEVIGRGWKANSKDKSQKNKNGEMVQRLNCSDVTCIL